jgi:HEAT repeat protein
MTRELRELGLPSPAKSRPRPEQSVGDLLRNLGSDISRKKLFERGPEIIPALVEALPDNVSVVARLGRFCRVAKAAIPKLVRDLADRNDYHPGSPARALEQMGELAVPALVEALKDRNPTLRAAAAKLLGRIAPEAREAVPALLEALKDKEPKVRFGAANALAEIGLETRELTAAISALRKDPDRKVRILAELLLRMADETARRTPEPLVSVEGVLDKAVLVEHMNEKAELVSHRLYGDPLNDKIRRLREPAPSLSLPDLVQFRYNARVAVPAVLLVMATLEGTEWRMYDFKLGAASASAEFIQALRESLKDTPHLRAEIAHALGQLGPRAAGALEDLKRLLRETPEGPAQEELRRALNSAIQRLEAKAEPR